METGLPLSAWNEWSIIEKIGEGSFGKVYKAQRTERGRSFYSAIKIISIPSSRSEFESVLAETGNAAATEEYFENIVEECVQEISMMENFRGNSHIVSVEDFKVIKNPEEVHWDIYIRMEYLMCFTEYCIGKKLSEKEVVKLGIDLCKSLEYCEMMNIIHRDIKPENIFVSRFGDFKLGDFGIARELTCSMNGYSKKGTDSYMAPEIYKGQNYDIRADIYSLGLMLYKLMNKNRLPFINLEKQLITYRDKELALNKRIAGEKLSFPCEASSEFGKIICTACEYKSEERFKNSTEFRNALEKLLEKKDIKENFSINDIKEDFPVINKVREGTSVRKREIQEKRKEYRRKKAEYYRRTRDPVVTMLGIAVVVIAIATCVLIGVYINLIMQNNVEKRTEEMVSIIEEQKYNVLEEKQESFAKAIETIDTRIIEIANEQKSYDTKGKEGERILYYNEDGTLMKALVYPSQSMDRVFEEYYYWNEQLIFAYIWYEDTVDMYYYEDGTLIRWIDNDNICHDEEEKNEEYVYRGDKYWSNAVMNSSY